ncbi:hypothetical protein GGR57DRAFT_498201 [Xylariaceae sp. FL1272]|nr:hypothetical protein GGR57DRAFT_498201 [Xylariaceae sp. FL1272]
MEQASRRPRGRTPSMPGEFPTWAETSSRQRSRSRPSPPSVTSDETESSYILAPAQSNPPRGILKNSNARQNQEDRLAARFYRVPLRTDQINHTPTPPHSPGYFTDSTYPDYDETDTNSAASELSINTQATSVASDYSDVKPKRPSVQAKHARPVHMPTTVSKVKTRPKTRALTEISKEPPPTKPKRTINIQIVPQQASQSKELQLARPPDRSLVHKLEQLESDTEDLRHARNQLTRRLDDASEELSLKTHENKEMVRTLNQERNSKDLIFRELEEQRRLFDEYRSNFELQRVLLLETEKERDELKKARTEAEKKLLDFEISISLPGKKKDNADNLQHQLKESQTMTHTLEQKVAIGEKKLKAMTIERDDLQTLSNNYMEQINVLKDTKQQSLESDRQEAEARQRELQSSLDGAREQNKGLQGTIKELERTIKNLEGEIVVFKAQITELETGKASVEKILAAEKANKEQTKKNLQADNDKLRKQFDKTRDDHRQQLATSKGEFEKQLEETRVNMATRLAASEEELAEHLEMSKTEKDELQQRITAGEAAKSEVEKQLQATKEDLAQAIASAKAEVDKLHADSSDKQSRIDGLVMEVAGSKKANLSLATQRLELERKVTDLSVNLATVQTELSSLRDTYNTMQIDNEQLKAQSANLSRKATELDKLRSEYAQLDEKSKSLQADLERAQADHTTLQAEKDKLEAHTKELEAGSPALFRLSEEKSALEAQLDQAKEDLQSEADKIPVLEKFSADLEARLAILLGETGGLKSENERLTVQLRELQTNSRLAPRSPSRSSSRAPSKDKRHGRSPSSSFVFVRSPTDRGGGVYITTREALAKEKEG